MKVIYMEQTLQLIARNHGPELAQQIISQGDVKQTEVGTYLIIK